MSYHRNTVSGCASQSCFISSQRRICLVLPLIVRDMSSPFSRYIRSTSPRTPKRTRATESQVQEMEKFFDFISPLSLPGCCRSLLFQVRNHGVYPQYFAAFSLRNNEQREYFQKTCKLYLFITFVYYTLDRIVVYIIRFADSSSSGRCVTTFPASER